MPTPTEVSSIRLASGWDHSIVDVAQVTIGGKTYQADYDGVVRFGSDLSGGDLTMDITASGYLFRQTFLLSTPVVTLWPADPADYDAIKGMVYTASGEMFSKFYQSDFLGSDDYVIGGDFARSPEGALLLDNLRSSSDHVSQVLVPSGANVFQLQPGPSLNAIDMALDLVDDTACSDPWGFCSSNTSRPYLVHVSRSAATRSDVALRLLAHLFLQSNSEPGLMNRSHPSSELSLLEQQTLRMMFQRGYVNRWPDNDRQ
jgi:hypothetical protein